MQKSYGQKKVILMFLLPAFIVYTLFVVVSVIWAGYYMRIDYEKEPPMFRITDTHYAATWLLDERAPKVKVPTGGRRDGK